ncbi:MAG TPA: cytochrome c [Rhizomicrobium sp.]|nr:cytochrome c [Rhizomicrobium sp.]
MKKIAGFAIAALTLALTGAPEPAQAQSGDAPGSVSALPVKPVTGQQVFSQVCQACHMADAKGGTGAATIPALAGNPHLEVAGYPITMVVQGRGAMPSFADLLSPAQIANVVGYVRTHFGNNYPDPVTEADVKSVLSAQRSRSD